MKFSTRQLEERENLHWFGDFLRPRFEKSHPNPDYDEQFKHYLNHSENGIPIPKQMNRYLCFQPLELFNKNGRFELPDDSTLTDEELEEMSKEVRGICPQCTSAYEVHLGSSIRAVCRKCDTWEERPSPLDWNYYAECKVWRGRTIHEIWEPSFYSQDGSWPGFYELLREEDGKPIPRNVAEFISREIFAGQDREKIMAVYEEVINDSLSIG